MRKLFAIARDENRLLFYNEMELELPFAASESETGKDGERRQDNKDN